MLRSFLLRVAVVVFVGALAIAISARYGIEHFQREQRAHDTECRAYRSRPDREAAQVCRGADVYGPHATDLFKQGTAALANAKSRLEEGNVASAHASIVRALTIARDIERRGRFFDEVVAASLLTSVVSFLDMHPQLDERALLHAYSFDGLRAPLEGERLEHLWMLAHADGGRHWLLINRSALASQMSTDDAAYRDVERAGLDGDTARCELAARKVHSSLLGEQGPLIACEKLPMIARTVERLEAAKHRAL